MIGSVEFIVGDLVTAEGQKLVMAIEDKKGALLPKNKGAQPLTIVRAQEVGDNLDEVELELGSRDLPKMGWCRGTNPFLQVYRRTDRSTNPFFQDRSWASVYQSEHMLNARCPRWPIFSVQTRRLCQGDMERPVLIRLWDWNRDAHAVLIAQIETTLAEMLDATSMRWRNVARPDQDCGELLIFRAEIARKFSFVSYLRGGLECHLMVAIDMTGSNGDPQERSSLHYCGAPDFESQYMKVIGSVGRVLAPYDADGDIHAYGFGANLQPMGKQVSHCFNLSLDANRAEVDGIEGLQRAYAKCLEQVQLYGPTHFGEIIAHAAANSTGICTQAQQQYNILLIITDGIINDWQRTADAIVSASVLPLSIVIVGVGDANFDKMQRLDADDDPLRHSRTGQVMQQCIVKFVAFNEFKEQHISAIAKETLDEIPEQVSNFMSSNGIHPNVPESEKGAKANGQTARSVDVTPSFPLLPPTAPPM